MFGYTITAINVKNFILLTNLSQCYGQYRMKKIFRSKYIHVTVKKKFFKIYRYRNEGFLVSVKQPMLFVCMIWNFKKCAELFIFVTIENCFHIFTIEKYKVCYNMMLIQTKRKCQARQLKKKHEVL